jgi:MFS transporter, DHA2 family, multidrug resistance protein
MAPRHLGFPVDGPTDAGLCARRDGTLGRSVRGECARAALLARSVQDQAYVLAYIDGFMVLGFAVIGALLLMLLLRSPPAQPRPLQHARGIKA